MIKTKADKKHQIKYYIAVIIIAMHLLSAVLSFDTIFSVVSVLAQSMDSQPDEKVFDTAYNTADGFAYGSGDGLNEDNAFLIATPLHLNNMRFYLNRPNPDYMPGISGTEISEFLPYYFNIIANVDLHTALSLGGSLYRDGKGWLPIGTGESDSSYFYGVLNGQGHSISNLWINRSDVDTVGLFGGAVNATIKNLSIVLDDIGIIGKYCAGGLAGTIEGRGGSISKIIACSIKGKIKTTDVVYYPQGLGGFVGMSQFLEISNSFFAGTLEGANETGGIIGSANRVSVVNCYAKASIIQKSNTPAGGIFGYVTNFYIEGGISNQINRCYIDLISDDNTDVFAGTVNNKFDIAFSYYFANENISIDDDKYYLNNVNMITKDIQKEKTSYNEFDFDKIWGLDKDGNIVLRAFGQAYDAPNPINLIWLYILLTCLVIGAAVIITALMLYRRKKIVVITKTERIEIIKEVPLEIIKEIPVAKVKLPDDLSEQEMRVAEFMLKGMSRREIAAKMKVTEGTIKTYMSRIYVKAGIDSQRDFLIRYLGGKE